MNVINTDFMLREISGTPETPVFSDAYAKRCTKALQETGAPTENGVCVGIVDVIKSEGQEKDDPGDRRYAACELCGCQKVRYLHYMEHDDYPEVLKVGCICAGIMQGDKLAAWLREKEFKNWSKRRDKFLKHKWKMEYKDAITRSRTYRGRKIRIIEKYKDAVVGNERKIIPVNIEAYVDGERITTYLGQPIAGLKNAILTVFDVVDPFDCSGESEESQEGLEDEKRVS